MKQDIQEILFSEDVLNKRIKELASEISNDYEGKNLVVVGILKGSVLFAAELIKNISVLCEIDFMAVSSYGSSTETSGVVRILKDLDNSIEGKDILLVEDIVDTGITLSYLLKYLRARNANSIEIISLLNKPARRKVDLDVKYIGFEVPDGFIVGYGIDYAEKYRNLPFIGILKPEVYNK
ncbi:MULTISPECIES: hypoxanthine phosphoribosyltransferase [Clostridium]|jgi:hypoxanthine phosphoribosyltransferase|uniref:Hypoxanthine phosphoribosyltransferase n=1 Tax=Clostridium saccharoperbutylacetonicum N1-4(HMT) TaxID=931276 RepID=M1MQP8_9CLOT|nr:MULTISPECIES: hypoxanthine phosphoribosyltransferase [Clostridium]AGF53957.1 hypoxanthine phosphoribosyltransferase Hpt [Clostridium saccharoperbutylacetonicum N1-4(HMT)]AQR92861.1 hypoxanthine-guanine phosphoribosyltransferase [Clostridium saccharoperbutylacetonicum]NRT59530.1 hypoxanthine phosphoribosyltransferase [Clostridium saccharoperbutylacetonicum]NSB28722.1 hypoxanthine phosphoribosyltransferase [Clostridium saccharoperbutylacetonicum]NSB34272.1 hypoxanthine phosphoribosyltransfera